MINIAWLILVMPICFIAGIITAGILSMRWEDKQARAGTGPRGPLPGRHGRILGKRVKVAEYNPNCPPHPQSRI